MVVRGLIPLLQAVSEDEHLLRLRRAILLQHQRKLLIQRVGAVTYVKRQNMDDPFGAVL